MTAASIAPERKICEMSVPFDDKKTDQEHTISWKQLGFTEIASVKLKCMHNKKRTSNYLHEQQQQRHSPLCLSPPHHCLPQLLRSHVRGAAVSVKRGVNHHTRTF